MVMTQFQEAEERFKAGLRTKHNPDLSEAWHHFEAATVLNPNFAAAYAEMGAINYAWCDSHGAVILLRKALALDPELPNANLFLALALGSLDEHEAAEAQFEKAILYSEHPQIAYTAYGDYLAQNKRPGAEEAFLKAFDHDPDCDLTSRDYARFLTRQGRAEEAETFFKKALQKNPDCPYNNEAYGRFLAFYDERCPEAVSLLRRALELKPDLKDAQDLLDEIANDLGLS